jgi:tryptophan-rich sensory protein
MNTAQIIKLVASLILTLGVGAIAGIFTSSAVTGWYATLHKPSFNPPDWLFGPVWTVLYIIMGISLFMIWKIEPSKERNIALWVFMIQLIVNFCWSFIFFHFKLIGPALIDIIVLWISIVVMLVMFYMIKPLAAYLNIPYLLWVSFASILNGAYYFLNR